ncbi:MAG: class I tRNA ligase family protein [Gemmatimonadales bacterium]
MAGEGDHSVVVAGSFVTAEDGTGLVHMAPAFGSDDFAMGREHGLALLRPVGADGAFTGTTLARARRASWSPPTRPTS